MLVLFNIILISYQWMRLLYLLDKLLKKKEFIRRWHVKPHITNMMRDTHGAYEALFLYFANCHEEEFYKMCRMNVRTFQKLHNLVGPRLQKKSRRRPLSTELRLALYLNYLGHGDSNFSTANFFRVGRSTVYGIIHEVSRVIWDVLSPIYLNWKSEEEWKIVAEGFRVKWDFPNCVGALDGKEIRIKAPPHSGSLYFNYKRFYSFKLMAICDAFLRFTWIDIGDYGSLSDASSFRNSSLYQALEEHDAGLPRENILPRTNISLPFFFVGDPIFALKTYLMKPYPRANGLTNEQHVFNNRLSRARQCIEVSFGRICSKFQILEDRLDFKVDTSVEIVKAIICLHNLIITEEMNAMEYDEPVINAPNVVDFEGEEDMEANDDAVRQREILREYFTSGEGQIL
ncbi:putative nuclease HARBI1 [Leptopilina heterotoma]|uniref:putative nuclease HARBI1 n=1 Tax=Leptopilina heterotoma TaxID=63436 RepID=UPI001CA89EB6|nr:putative nuclease HARBI1 [Leptopilina heterotoma]